MGVPSYPEGATLRLSNEFKFNDVLADAAEIYLDVSKGLFGTTTTYQYGVDPEVIRDGVGLYHADFLADITGIWLFTWYAVNPAMADFTGYLAVIARQT